MIIIIYNILILNFDLKELKLKFNKSHERTAIFWGSKIRKTNVACDLMYVDFLA